MQTGMIRIGALSHDRFDEVFSIMEHSFPPDEMRPYREQMDLLTNKWYKIIVALDESDRIIAFAATWQFEDVLFIEHLATRPDMRGQGIGAELLSYLTCDEKCTVLLEVEPPENDLTRRRIAFYERNGFVLNLYPYIQPSISKGRAAVPLMIMTHCHRLSEPRFKTVRDILYKEVYKTSAEALGL